MEDYTIGIIAFSDISPAFTTTNTTGSGLVGSSFTVSSTASPLVLTIQDDDDEFDDGFIDFPNNSTSGNNQLVAEPFSINGTDYGPAAPGGTPQDQVELEFAFTTTDGDTYYVVRIDGVNVGLTGPRLPQPDQSFEIASVSDGSDDPYVNVICFAAGTRIATPDGEVAVEDIAAGDLVLTVDAGPQPVRWVGCQSIGVAELLVHHQIRPVVFAPGAIGNARQLVLSPQHRVLLTGWRAELLFGETEILVPAKALLNDSTVRVAPVRGPVHYYHILFDTHQLVISEGAVTESLLPAQAALNAQPDILALESGAADDTAPSARIARPVLKVTDANLLAAPAP
ncbi:MAG: Hint domain-containing protein [Pseudomonadota bacterium]